MYVQMSLYANVNTDVM